MDYLCISTKDILGNPSSKQFNMKSIYSWTVLTKYFPQPYIKVQEVRLILVNHERHCTPIIQHMFSVKLELR